MKRNTFLQMLLCTVLLLPFVPAFAQQAAPQAFTNFHVRSELGSDGAPFSWNFRMRKGSPTGPVLYVFPPMGQPTTYLTKYKTFRPLFADPAVNVVVLSASLDEIWILTPEMQTELTDKIIPQIEREQLGLMDTSKTNRSVIGLSRGGFNAIQILLNKPSFFKRSLLLSPFISSFGFSASDDEIKPFAQRYAEWDAVPGLKEFNPQQYESNLNYSVDKFLMTQHIVRDVLANYGGEARFNMNNPFSKAQSIASTEGLGPMTIYANRRDEYSFAEGTERFTQILTSKGASIKLTINEEGEHMSEINDSQLIKKILNDFSASISEK